METALLVVTLAATALSVGSLAVARQARLVASQARQAAAQAQQVARQAQHVAQQAEQVAQQSEQAARVSAAAGEASARAARELADNDNERRADELQDRQAERDHARRAFVVPTSSRTVGQRRLVLSNSGGAPATDVTVSIHPAVGMDPALHLPWLAGTEDRYQIPPGASVPLLMSSSSGTAPKVRVDVSWSDEVGSWDTQTELLLA